MKVPSKSHTDRQVTGIYQLGQGDHILWHRSKGYSHHAIVENVIRETKKISVINYAKGDVKLEVKCEIVDAFNSGALYIREYDECDVTETVMERAYSKVGQRNYDLIVNNCEHFATWCKTGLKKSLQVKTVKKALGKHIAKSILITGTKHVVKNSVKKTISKEAPKRAVDIMKRTSINGSKSIIKKSTVKSTKSLIKKSARASKVSKVCTGISIGVEVIDSTIGIAKAVKKRERGEIDDEELTIKVTQQVTKGVGSFAGGAGGAIIGQALIPVPVVGAVIGSTVGGLIGEGAGFVTGSVLGKGLGKLFS